MINKRGCEEHPVRLLKCSFFICNNTSTTVFLCKYKYILLCFHFWSNSIHKNQQSLWAPVQGELWQRVRVPAEEAAEVGRAAAEENKSSQSKLQQESKDRSVELRSSLLPEQTPYFKLFKRTVSVSLITEVFCFSSKIALICLLLYRNISVENKTYYSPAFL